MRKIEEINIEQVFENPQNNYRETLANEDVLLALVFGPAFFLAKGIYGWAIIMSLISTPVIINFVMGEDSLTTIFLVVYAAIIILLTKGILRKHYLRNGWIEIVPETKEEK